MRQIPFDYATKELLISLVSKQPVLYDRKNPDYRKSTMREVIWRKIGNNLKKSGKACKNEWKKLKGCYYNYINKSDKENYPNAKLYERMKNFLDSGNHPEATRAYEVGEPSTSGQQQSTEPMNVTDGSNNNERTPQPQRSSDNSQREHSSKNGTEKKVPKKKINTKQKTSSKKCMSTRHRNELIRFNRQIEPLLIDLPPGLRYKARDEIFEILYKYKALAITIKRC
ncbi:hypothetical protein PYW08_002367 [Mythimna loreyi]|uniref:Uncharacterized protein n=1 Tax=Mythimna loreyi TaxID=667449 RepID=A0ACC2R3X5_9NEOP|nr:hypothetical protein PYW08_002367 [Mythimna loreyi]